jgi:MFS family permease
VPAAAEVTASYRGLFRVSGMPRLVSAALLGRTGQQMGQIATVLFALDRFHSPTIAGLYVLLVVLPGLMVAPIAGALLDRRGRTALIMLDYLLAAACGVLVIGLAVSNVLTPWMLLTIAAVSSLTGPLSNTGTRTLFPLLVPRELWDRANAIDSGGFVLAIVAGPGIVGVVVATWGTVAGLVATAVMFGLAALVLVGLADPPRLARRPTTLLRDARDGLVYVVTNPALRGLAIGVSLSNLGYGIAIVAVPVLVIDHLHSGAGTVGALWALVGAGGAVSSVIAGRYNSDGRERHFISGGMGGITISLLTLAVAPSVAVAALAMIIFGAANGPFDIGLFSLRQRRTDPAWLGRAFAVSMALNFCGVPIGSALAGPVLAIGLGAAFAAGAVASVAGAAVILLMIPPGASEHQVAARAGHSVT